MPRKVPEGKRFQPGVSGNPNGRPKVPDEVKQAKKLTAALFYESVNRLTSMTRDELEAYVKSPLCTMLDRMIIGQMQAAVKGKTSPLQLILERTAGPVKQQIEMTSQVTVSSEQAIKMAERMLKKKNE